tara:strand:- start:182 stop:388 length:207 start_codon:yes stop_codon:yes gene_type:complete
MNNWVEWWEVPSTQSGSHAQMSENLVIYKPEPEKIQRRFFDTPEQARDFATRQNDHGYYAVIKQDRGL